MRQTPNLVTYSPNTSDLLSGLVQQLRPRAMVWAGLRGSGRWAVSFRQREDVLFCWIELGECQLIRAHSEPLRLRQNDFILIRTTMPFVLASDPFTSPEESEALVASTNDLMLKVGTGHKELVRIKGGRFTFDERNRAVLTSLLPTLVHVTSNGPFFWRLNALLKLIEAESAHPGDGSDFLLARLLEAAFVEILRHGECSLGNRDGGLLAGLVDPVTARALSIMHGNVANDWTVAHLARLCGVSRSSFAERFRRIVGVGPMKYLRQWRMSLAKEELRLGSKSIAEVALAVGFHSASAFSTAFTNTAGVSPAEYQLRVHQNPQ